MKIKSNSYFGKDTGWYRMGICIDMGTVEISLGYNFKLWCKEYGLTADAGIYLAVDRFNFWRIWINLIFFWFHINKQTKEMVERGA